MQTNYSKTQSTQSIPLTHFTHPTQTTSQPRVSKPLPVLPVYGTCGHIAKSAYHTCGNPRCVDMFGW
jgi:hypothetical protein